ncbi:5-formyltetrahydrofolate cyclo-ligase isoform X2 [Linepithema humile]|uniref:5-formyltetrahydrofolate cyclo-ligase isoform X2 n=1 Tax=Linepithema humile TaxID=83485 RepID=UPI0006237DF0|nr:PREDICTED: 5-formyltetrahydrofolate cyclo-ligase isoform X2 [Linepithema humile]
MYKQSISSGTSNNMAALTSAKSVLRKEIKDILINVNSEEKREQSANVFRKLCALKQYQESKRVSLYLSTKDEIDTVPILKHIFDMGKEAFVPQYRGKNMEMVKLKSIEDYETLPLTKWNIKQPNIVDCRENALETDGLDLIILPGVAFTRNGKRLGHGMGYYDKYLKRCFQKQNTRPYLIAIGFKEQIREDIPTNEDDVAVDIVLTG